MKRIRHYPALSEHIWNQLRFRTWDQWLVQGLLLLSAMLLALWLRREHPENREMLTVCSVFFVFAGNICLSRVARLFSWHMAELEQTLYLNLRQMICIRMLEAGIADLIMLVLFLGITGRDSGIGIGASLLYMLVPFLWSDTLYLHILTCLRNTSYRFSSFALGTLCGVLALFPVLWEQAYAPEYRVIWQVLALTGLLLLTAEIRSMLTQIEKGDHICQN